MFEAMVYILRVGCPWRDLPAIFGPWNSVYTRWRRWCLSGLWEKLLRTLARKAQGQLRFVDTSHIKVHQDASNPAGGQQKSGDWAYQGRPEYQAQCLGGQPRAARQFELGPGTSGRCKHSARRGAPAVAENDDCCRQGLRQRRVPGAIAAMGKPGLYSTPLQPAPARQLAPRPLPQAAQGREIIPTIETQPEGWDTL